MKNRIIRLYDDVHDAYNDDGARVIKIIERHVDALLDELQADALAQAADSDDNPAYARAEIETMTANHLGYMMVFASATRDCKARMEELGLQVDDY